MAVATPFSCWWGVSWGLVREEGEGGGGKGEGGRGKGKGEEGGRKYLADLLPQDFGLHDHALTMRCLP